MVGGSIDLIHIVVCLINLTVFLSRMWSPSSLFFIRFFYAPFGESFCLSFVVSYRLFRYKIFSNILTFFKKFLSKDGDLIQHALSFYRLMIVWLVDLVGGFKMPLPDTCPMEFACMPEHFVEDAMELLIFASRIPKALDGVLLVSCIFS